MQIACKCLNVISSSDQIDKNCTAIHTNKILDSLQGSLANLEDSYQKTSRVFADCSEFLRLAYGPVTDLKTIISQNDLIYKVPVEPWYLHYCINCNKITHATHTSNAIFLINSNLLRKNEEIVSMKGSKAYSSAFGVLMIDHQPTTPNLPNNQQNHLLGSVGGGNSAIGNNDLIFQFNRTNSVSSNSNEFNQLNNKTKQQIRIRGLNNMLQNRLQKEIDDTSERIRRFTEQQFALLKSYREKTEQEYQILINLVNQVPEQLKVIDAIDNLTTASGKGDGKMTATLTGDSTNRAGTIDNTQQQLPSSFLFKNQQVSSLDTPPATPDSTPMSVGNSPTFRQQGNNSFGNNGQRNNSLAGNVGDENDCLFELEGLENYPSTVSNNMSDVEETEDAEDALGELDSGFPIGRFGNQRRGSLNMAKSLPISITNNFMPNNLGTNGPTKFNYEDLEDESTEDAGLDIAASIKALAKSVHGDTIFGDLPRPRFSTQI